MIVMPANNSMAHRLESRFPGRSGLLIGLGGWRDPKGLRFAVDNGRFAATTKGRDWDADEYKRFIDRAAPYLPMWGVVPDVVGDALATFDWWDTWRPELSARMIPCALAVQDGMTPEAVTARCDPLPDVIFIGGTTEWKRRTVWQWCHAFHRVHVGRVNYERWLWNAHRCGAESTDGTGWFRGDKNQLRGLYRYLDRSSKGMEPAQLELEFSRTFHGGTRPRKTMVT